MIDVNTKNKCCDTRIQQNKVKQSIEKSLNKGYLEEDMQELAEVIRYCGRNCQNLHSCKPFNELVKRYALFYQRFLELDDCYEED